MLGGVGSITNPRTRFGTASLPKSLSGFEDLVFLFSSNVLNHGIAALRLDEAAYLYGLVRSLGSATIVEIGRFMGGSTFLIAAAMDERSILVSYDLHVYRPSGLDHEQLDGELVEALVRYGLQDRVSVIVGDSRTAQPPTTPCDLVFVDGDHTYEGVRADYEHWGLFVRPGGHLVFHDAIRCDFQPHYEGASRLVREIEERGSGSFVRTGSAGSLVHFVRTGVA